MGDRYRYNESGDGEPMPFEGIDKASVLQKCRMFNDTPLDESGCIQALLQVLYLISTRGPLTVEEATDVFFMSTNMMRSSNLRLRRLLYILFKELSPLVEHSFIASNSLMVDTKQSSDSVRCNAIRTLCKVMDSSLHASLDRTVVEWTTSSNPNVVTAALVAGMHMAHTHPEMLKKWSAQLVEVIKGRSKAQYVGIALTHHMRNNDRLSVNRLIELIRNGQISLPLAICLVVRLATQLMQEDFNSSLEMYQFVTSMLRHRSEFVVLEAARSICSLPCVTDQEVTPTVMALQCYLSSTYPVLRFASVLLLNQIAVAHPAAVTPVNNDVENLMFDSNRLTATLAITTLLKTGTEYTIDRLLSQTSSSEYANELGDELKMVIVDAMLVLNTKFPSKYSVLLAFLFKGLSEEGSSHLKHKVVDTMIDITKTNRDSVDVVLRHLAEFIDDCEFPQITKRVLLYFGEEVPLCSTPKRFVRYVYNHATLERPEVRAVAVTTLAKLAARLPSLRRSIVALLKRSCMDSDDEVRDRAILYTKLFLTNDEAVIHLLVEQVTTAVATQRVTKSTPKPKVAGVTVHGGEPVPVEQAQVNGEGHAPGSSVTSAMLQGRIELRRFKQLSELGEPLHSVGWLPLTDADNEYVVSVMKHTYADHLVLQFKVRNTMDGVSLTNITVLADTEELEAEPLYAIPIAAVEPGAVQYAYVVLRYEPEQFPSGTVECTFKFSMKEGDSRPMGEEEYPLESLDVDISDFITPTDLGSSGETKWEELEANETAGTYALRSMRNLTVAAHELATFFGMHVEGGVPDKIFTSSHTLNMAGTVANTDRTLILVRAKVFISTDNSVALHLALRGGSEELRSHLANTLLS